MAAPLLSVYVADAPVKARLQRLRRKLGNLQPAFENIGQALLLNTDERFEREVDPRGVPWPKNSPYTIAQKRAQGRIQKILQNRGLLRDSINYQATRDRLVIGTLIAYGAKHQLGQGVPKREFLGISKEDEQEIIAILDEFLAEP